MKIETHWYLIHTKPRQEKRALENLERQDYVCYFPQLPTEKITGGKLVLFDAPLFPRYLFIQLDSGLSAKSWGPIRSTQGVSQLVRFGDAPAKVDERLIEILKSHEANLKDQPAHFFEPGTKIRLSEGPFDGLEGIYQMADGQARAMVLIEFMSKPVVLGVPVTSIHKVDY